MKSAHRILLVGLVGIVLALGQAAPSQADVSSVPTSGYPGFNLTVRVIVHQGNTVYVGGDFTRVTDANGTHDRNHVAAFDATTGLVLPWNPNVGGATVSAIQVNKRAVFLGGQFSSVRGQPRRNLARVSAGGAGTLTAGFKRGAGAPVRALAVSKGRLLVGGDFMKLGGKPRYRAAAVRLKAPYQVTAWAPKVQTGGVRDILSTSRGIYLAGDFRKFGGKPHYQRLVLVNAKTGKLNATFNPALPIIVFGVVQSGGVVYAAVGGPDGGQLLAVRADTGRTVWSRGLDGDGQAIGILDGRIYLGGHFNRVCAVGTTGLTDCEADPAVRRRLAAFDPSGSLTGWDPEGNSSSGVFAVHGFGPAHLLMAGGAFTTMNQGTVSARRLAVFSSAT